MADAPVSVSLAKPSQLDEMKRLLDGKELKQGMYQAVKRTTAAGKAIMVDLVTDETFIAEKYAKRVITTKVKGENPPEGTISIKQQLVPLVGFQNIAYSRAAGGGVVVKVSKDRPVISLRHAFKVRLRTAEQAAGGFAGHVGIVTRATHLSSKGPNIGKGKITPRGYAGRFAIQEQFGPSVLQIIDAPKVTEEALEKLGDRLQHEAEGQIQRFTDARIA